MTSVVGEVTFGRSELTQLVSSWWFHYDEWEPETLRALVVDDFSFKCTSDTGATAYEDFIRIDTTGADEVMAWQENHRLASPYPLRHNLTNMLVTSREDGSLAFKSYVLVNKIVDGRPHALSSGIVNGSARASDGTLLLTSMEIVLDTRDSVGYSEVFGTAT